MKTYNKLMRIKYNNKLYDIFSDENHRKVFLEVKVINGEEKYFYISVRDYFCLNNIYNIEKAIYFSESDNDTENKNKKKFKYQLFVAFASGIIIPAAIFSGLNALTNAKLVRDLKIKSASYDDNYIKNIEQLEDFFEEEISFDDVRKTLNDNKQIPEKYKVYIEKYIDCLEERFPQVNLRCFNENLRKMKFNIIDSEKWENEKIDGYIQPFEYETEITLKDQYYSEEREEEVVFHELTHALRQSYIGINNNCKWILYKYNISVYGNTFDEAFVELFTQYLLTENYEQFFDEAYKYFGVYSEYTTNLYQILKLADGKYTFSDFFDYNITGLEKILSEYGLSDLIELYDVDLENYRNNITTIDRSRINDLEKKLIKLRVQQEIEKGTEISEIYTLATLFNYNDNYKNETDKVLEISKYIEEHGNYQYYAFRQSQMIKNDNNSYYNPLYEFYSEDELVYSNYLYKMDGGQYVNNDLYIVSVVEKNAVIYKICKKIDDKYIDIQSNSIIESSLAVSLLTNFINVYRYDIKINLNNFLESSFLHKKMTSLNTAFYHLNDLKNKGATEYDIYQEAEKLYPNKSVELANVVLNSRDIGADWVYKLTKKCGFIVNDISVDGINIEDEARYTNPNFKIYYDNQVIYNDYLHEVQNGEVIRKDISVAPVVENNKIAFKLVKYEDEKYIDIITNEQVYCIGNIVSLTNFDYMTQYDVEINAGTFLKTDFVEKKLLEVNSYLFDNISTLSDFKDSGATEHEVYQKAREICDWNWVECANIVLGETNEDWVYRLGDQVSTLPHNEMILDENGVEIERQYNYANPNFKIYYDNQVIYNDYLLEIQDGEMIRKNIAVAPVVENNKIAFKLVKYEDEKYVDIITNEQVYCIGSSVSLTNFDYMTQYDVEINAGTFLKTDFVEKMLLEKNSDLFDNISTLSDFKDSGATDHEVYQKAREIFGWNWIECANLVLGKTNEDWIYRLGEQSSTLPHKEMVLDENGVEVEKQFNYINPYLKIFKNGEVIYEGYKHYIKDDKLISPCNIYIGMRQTDTETQFRVLRYLNGQIFDFFTGEKISSTTQYSLRHITAFLISGYDYEINLDNFMNSDILFEEFGVANKQESTIRR